MPHTDSSPEPSALSPARRVPFPPIHFHSDSRGPRYRPGGRRRLALRARLGAGQRTDYRHLDRHAARGSPAGVRLHQGEDAGDRRARRRRRRVRTRLLARAADAAGARLDPVGAAAVRDRRARQRRLHGEGRRAPAAADAARARLRDRRHRLGLRAAQGNRHRPGIRLLRRRDAAQLARALDRPGPARRRRVREDRRALARHHRHLARLPLPAPLRAAQAVRAAGPVRGLRAVRRRDRLHRRNRRPPGAVPEVAPALRSVDDRAAVGPRRRARRSRRAGARPLRLRRGDPRAAHHQAGRERRRRTPDRGPGPAHRPGADDSRPREGARRRQPARPIAQAGARRHGQAASRPRSTRRRSTPAITSAGAS